MNNNFIKKLNSARRKIGAIHVMTSVLLIVLLVAIVILLVGLVDHAFVLSNGTRLFAVVGSTVIGAILALVAIIRFIRVPGSKASERIDKASGKGSAEVEAAYSLTQQEQTSGLKKYLSEKALEEAADSITKIPVKAYLPIKQLGFACLGLLVLAGGVFGIRAIHQAKFDTVVKRLINPTEDIPPYTDLKFELKTESLEVVYGDALAVAVRVTGESLEEDVVCLVRQKGESEVAELFTVKDGRDVFLHQFKNVIQEMEFSFKAGHARSIWYDVSVITQPDITGTEIEVIPPSYTKMETKKYKVEGDEIPVVKGSKIRLRVSSNRPLSSGKIQFSGQSEEIKGRELTSKLRKGSKTIEFEWIANATEKLDVNVFDVRATGSKIPLKFTQKVLQDVAPEVAISGLEPRVLATPEMELKMLGEVEDDYGVADVSIFKSLVGFRDRGEIVEKNLDRKEYDYEEKISLPKIGVKPGQMLAFYLEARDYNPSRLGVTSSDPVIVEVISEEQYALILRDRVVLKQFSKRYKVVSEQLGEAKDSLEKLKDAIESGDEKQIAEMRKQAQARHKQTSELLEKIANDFKAFDMEGALKQIAKEGVRTLQENIAEIDKKQADLTKEDVEKMLEKLGKTEAKAKDLKRDAELMDNVAKVLRMSSEFQRLYLNQQSIVKRMSTLAKEMAFGNDKNIAQLESLGKLQEKNKKALAKFAEELKKNAEELPEEFSEIKDSALSFLDKMEELKIPSPMASAAKSAEDGRSRDASNSAYLAQQLMKQLMDESEGFG